MPTYVYRCENGHTFELFHSISDESPKRCPECGAEAKRVPAGGAGLLFKGSGFYITDYRSKGYQESAKKERGDKPAGEPGKGGSGSGAGGTPGGAAPGSGSPGASESKPAKPAGGAPSGGSGKPEKA